MLVTLLSESGHSERLLTPPLLDRYGKYPLPILIVGRSRVPVSHYVLAKRDGELWGLRGWFSFMHEVDKAQPQAPVRTVG